MKRENTQLGAVGVAGLARLTPRDPGRDHDVAEVRMRPGPGAAVGLRRKRQDVGRDILAAVLAIELANVAVGHERDGDVAAGAERTERGQPAGQAAVRDGAAPAVRHGDTKTTVGIHRTIRTP